MFPIPFFDDSYHRTAPQPHRPADDPGRQLAFLVVQRLARVLGEPARQVTVEAQNRVVLLDGRVDSAATAEAVGGLVWDIPGVADVRNSLTWPLRARRTG